MTTQSASSSKALPFNKGLLDSGAIAIEGLIQAVLKQDRSAHVDVAKNERPFFSGLETGSGVRHSTGFASPRMLLENLGLLRSFPCRTRPSTTTPLHHINGPQTAMIIDFSTGSAMDAHNTNPNIYQLETNHKGHYVLDVVHYLTKGNQVLEVRVHEHDVHELHQQQIETLEFNPVCLEDALHVQPHQPHDMFLERSRTRLRQLHSASQSHRASPTAATTALMGNRDSRSPRNSRSPSTRHVAAVLHPSGQGDARSARADHEPDAEGQGSTLRSGEIAWVRTAGIQGAATTMLAMPRGARDGHDQCQRPRSLGTHCMVRNLRLMYEPRRGSPANSTKTENPGMVNRMLTGRHHANGSDLSGHAEEDRRRGSSPWTWVCSTFFWLSKNNWSLLEIFGSRPRNGFQEVKNQFLEKPFHSLSARGPP